MKKIILPLSLLVFASFNSFAQTISEKQFFLISKITADWCPKCGDYGWSIFKDLEKEYTNKDVLVLAIHKSSSGIKTKSSEKIAETFGGFGQPLFFINDAEKEGVNSDNWKTKLAELKDDVNLLSLGAAPFLGVNSIVQLQANGKYKIIVKAKAFDNINVGEYYAGVYLINDNLIAPQSSQSSMAKHTGVLRENLLGEENTFGVKMLTTPLVKGKEATFEKSDVEIKIGSQSAKDFRIATILWNKRGDKFVFNNAAVVPLQTLLSSDKEIAEESSLMVRYDAGQKIIEVKDSQYPITALTLFNQQGQVVSIKTMANNEFEGKISLTNHIQGMYFLRVGSNDGRIQTKSVLVLE